MPADNDIKSNAQLTHSENKSVFLKRLYTVQLFVHSAGLNCDSLYDVLSVVAGF